MRTVSAPRRSAAACHGRWRQTRPRSAWAWPRRASILREFKPQAVLSTGGYASFPVAVAARAAGIPLAVVSARPDTRAGRCAPSARLAQRVAVTAVESLRRLPGGKSVVTGYPVREEFWQANSAEGRERLGLDPKRRCFSCPARRRARTASTGRSPSELNALLQLCEVVHLSGRADEPWLGEIRDGLPDELRARYHLYGYLHEEVPWAMAAADLAVCRSGASDAGRASRRRAAGDPRAIPLRRRTSAHQRALPGATRRGRSVLDDEDLDKMLPLVGELLHDEAAAAQPCARRPPPGAARSGETASPASSWSWRGHERRERDTA